MYNLHFLANKKHAVSVSPPRNRFSKPFPPNKCNERVTKRIKTCHLRFYLERSSGRGDDISSQTVWFCGWTLLNTLEFFQGKNPFLALVWRLGLMPASFIICIGFVSCHLQIHAFLSRCSSCVLCVRWQKKLNRLFFPGFLMHLKIERRVKCVCFVRRERTLQENIFFQKKG